MKSKFELIHSAHCQGQFLNSADDVPSSGLISFFNLFSIARMFAYPKLWKMDRYGIDGFLLVLVFKFFGIRTQRLSFDMTSLAKILFEKWAREGQSIALVGAQEHEVRASAAEFQKQYPTLRIQYISGGHFASSKEREECIQELVQQSFEVLIVGMGAVHQEQFLLDCQAAGWTGLGISCGGFLHQSSSGTQYYPAWMDRMNLRWLYRIWDEPKLLSRYALDYPKALGTLALEYLKWRLFR